MILLSATFALLWAGVARRAELRTADADIAVIRASRTAAIAAIFWYVAATGFAVLAPIVSLTVFALMAVAFAALRPGSRPARLRRGTPTQGE